MTDYVQVWYCIEGAWRLLCDCTYTEGLNHVAALKVIAGIRAEIRIIAEDFKR